MLDWKRSGMGQYVNLTEYLRISVRKELVRNGKYFITIFGYTLYEKFDTIDEAKKVAEDIGQKQLQRAIGRFE